MDSELVSLREVSFAYPQARRFAERFPGLRREAVSGVTFPVMEGECVALLGGNGSGKSTLLHLLDGLLEPAAGEMLWKGRPMDRSRRGLARMRAEVGFLFQDPDDQLFAQTLVQDAAFGPLNQGLPDREARDRALEALDRVGLADFAELPPHVLSHGMRKRAALAGVFAPRPRLLLLDEPTAGLDPESEDRFLAILDRFLSEGGTVLLSTHDLELARELCPRSLVLSAGRVAADGPTETVLSDRGLLVSCGLARRPVRRGGC